MINIQDSLFVDIKIDGSPLNGPNLLGSLFMTEGTPVTAPAMVMVLNDNGHELSSKLLLTDSNEIVITVGKTSDAINTVSRQYRLYNMQQVASQSGPTLRILALYDAVNYTTTSARDSYSGTSDAVLKQIAEKCKLVYDGPVDFNGRQTNDSQVWLNVAKTRAAFAQHEVARYGYMDEHSAMYAALTSLGVLKYRNVMDVIATPLDKIQYMFSHNALDSEQDSTKTTYLVQSAKEISLTGDLNTMYNYGSTMIVDGISGESDVLSKVDVKTTAPYLAINDQVAETIGRTNIAYGMIDGGNCHDNYYKAAYQNAKQLALFSKRQAVLVSEPTDVQLFDVVIYKQADEDPSKTVSNSDVYIVVGKTIFVQGIHYGERIELARMSITEKGEAVLKTAEPARARELAIPDTLINPTATIAADTLPRARGILGITNPIQAAVDKAKAAADQVLNNINLIQPSMLRMSLNLQNALETPLQAAKDIKAGLNSARQLAESAKQMRDQMKTAATAIRDGNVLMIADSVSSMARTAAYFQPTGIANTVCSMFGVTQTLKSASEVYNVVSTQLQTLRAPLDAVVNIGSEIDQLTSSMTSVIGDYQSIVGDVASSYNSMIQAVTGVTPNFQIPNLEINRAYFEDMMRDAIKPSEQPLYEIAYALPTVSDVQQTVANTLNFKDDTRHYMWTPESGFSVAGYTMNDLPALVNKLADNFTNADNQNTDYTYERNQS